MEKELEQCRGYICTPGSWLLGQQMYSMDFPLDVGKGGDAGIVFQVECS